jgi:hypothetical protein
MITIKAKGDLSKTIKFLNGAAERRFLRGLDKYGQEGVAALSAATPVDTGKTAASWSYEIVSNEKGVTIMWKNSNVVKGVPIALVLQYGHATRNGGYIQGRDYINPALRPIFDKILDSARKEVKKL